MRRGGRDVTPESLRVRNVRLAPDLRAEANRFLTDAYHGVSVRPGKGPPHAQAVAAVLRRAGSDERAQLVGLLHDVVEDTPRTIGELRERFGEPIAAMVDALTEDTTIKRYAQRKRALRNAHRRGRLARGRRGHRRQDRQPAPRGTHRQPGERAQAAPLPRHAAARRSPPVSPGAVPAARGPAAQRRAR